MASLDQNIVSLLASKSTQALLRFVPAADLVLICCALSAATHAMPTRSLLAGRAPALLTKVLLSVAMGTTLNHIARTQDAPLAATGLLAVYFWAGALDPAGELSMTSQYLLVSTLTDKLRGDATLLMASWALAFSPRGLRAPHYAVALAQLVTAETLSTWLMRWMPRNTLLAATVVLLYLLAPFTESFPALGRLYRFAVFALSNDEGVAGLPVWLVAAALWAVWRVERDPVVKRLASVAGVSFAVLALLDAMRFAMDNDPAPTLLALLVTLRILESRPA